jgi:hypothetical protein
MTTTILILAANPADSARLRLDEEIREIENGLGRAKHREQFTLEAKWAVRPRDVQRAMLDYEPNIIHFCGHGGGNEGIAFEDDQGNTRLVQTEALAGLFELFADKIQCVVLNACYSEVQAKAIARHVPYVVGMNKAIGDKAAVEFAVAFYDAIGAGKSIEFAYKLGRNAIQMAGIPEHLTPVLIHAGNLDSSTTPLSSPKIANLLYADRKLQPDAYVIEMLERGLREGGYQLLPSTSARSLDIHQEEHETPPEPQADILVLSSHSIHDHGLLERVKTRKKAHFIPVCINFTDTLPEALNLYLHGISALSWQSPADDANLLHEIISRIENPLPATEAASHEPPLTRDTLKKKNEPDLWLSFVLSQNNGSIIAEWLEGEADNRRTTAAINLLPFHSTPQQAKALTEVLLGDAETAQQCLQALLQEKGINTWQDASIRIRIMTDDPELAMFPWQQAQPQGTSGWIVETGPLLRRYLPGFTPHSLSTPLLVIPAEHRHDIAGDKHFALMQEYVASYLDIRGPIPRVSSPAQLQREITLHQPDLLYLYAKCEGTALLLDSDYGADDKLPLETLGNWLKEAEIRPVVILSLIGNGLASYPQSLADNSRLLWIQHTRRLSRIDDLEENLAGILEGLAQNPDLAALILQSSQNSPRELKSHLWLNGRTPTIDLASDAARRSRQLRAALLKVMLGRTELKERMFSSIYRSEYINNSAFLVYAVCGDEMACPFDFPAQLQQRLQWDDLEHNLPVIPFYFHLDINPDEDAFDTIDTALSEGILHGSSDIGLIFQRELARRGLLNRDCCISLNWLIRTTTDRQDMIQNWLKVWAEILCSDFAPVVPTRTVLVSAACLQLSSSVADYQTIQDIANRTLSMESPCPLRLIRIRNALGKLEPDEISDFLQDNQRWRQELRLDEFKIQPYDYADWVYAQAKGDFDSTVRLVWQQYQHEYQLYLGGKG